jgi:pimeloyl-ACP methyl ester carboxylesterase
VTVPLHDPHGPATAVLDDGLLRDVLYDALGSWRTLGRLPLFIHAAYGGDWEPMSHWVHSRAAAAPAGVFYCILCSEDVRQIDEKAIANAAARTFVGEAPLRREVATCADWPRGWLPDAYFEPVAARVPALLLTGEFDHVTPPEYAEKAAWHLQGSRQLVLPGRGHQDLDPCVVGLYRDVLAHGRQSQARHHVHRAAAAFRHASRRRRAPYRSLKPPVNA